MSIRSVKQVDNLVMIKHAIISVFNKNGLDMLVLALIQNCPEIKIYTSGGTYKFLKTILTEDAFAKHIIEVSAYTGQPETEGGLVKTLNHKLFLGYLTETYCEAHQADLEREQAVPIDLVVINLYPFQEVAAGKPAFEVARGHIDVGGPSALRAAAKNFLRVMTLTSPSDYIGFVHKLEINRGATQFIQRWIAAGVTYRMLGEYDTAIAEYFRTFMGNNQPSIISEYFDK